jgi:hypothetical protein
LKRWQLFSTKYEIKVVVRQSFFVGGVSAEAEESPLLEAVA